MNCEQIREILMDFLDGKLDGERARAVRLHLASCTDCASRLSPADRMEILPVLDEEIEPSAGFAARFQARLRERSVSGQREAWWRRLRAWGYPWKLAAGVLIVLIAVGVFWGRFPGRSSNLPENLNDLPLAENLPLLQDMAVISNLDLLENFDAIEELTKEERGEK